MIARAFAILVATVLVLWLARCYPQHARALRRAGFRVATTGRAGQFAVTAAAAFLSLVVVHPASPRSTPAGSTAILYDTSRSMSADDVAPSRRAAAARLVTGLVRRAEGAFALVAFAGESTVVAPLTRDTDAIVAAVTEIEAAALGSGAGSVPAAAIADGVDLLAAGAPPRRIVLISDGEWTSEAGLDDALARARELGVRVVAVGIGTEAGAPIAHDAAPSHHSALSAAALERVAAGSRNALLLNPASPAAIAAAVGAPAPAPGGAWTRALALAAALVLLVVPEAARWRRRDVALARRPAAPRATGLLAPADQRGAAEGRRRRAIAIVFVAILAPASCARDALTSANARLDAGQCADAAARLAGPLEGRDRGAAVARFNLGLALHCLRRDDEAAAAFAASGPLLARDVERARAAYNRGIALADAGRLVESEAAFLDALMRDSAFADARVNLEIVRARLPRTAVSPPPPVSPRYKLPAPGRAARPSADW